MYIPKFKQQKRITRGGEFTNSQDNSEYIGEYFLTPINKPYIIVNNRTINLNPISIDSTPPNPDTREGVRTSERLENPNKIYPIPYSSTFKYHYEMQSKPPIERDIPSHSIVSPTSLDIDNGVFVRYFCKKNNELKYIEIDKKTYNLLNTKSKSIAWDLYTPKSIVWKLKGEKEKVFEINKSNILFIEKKEKWYGFSQYFKEDFTKYHTE